MSFQNITFSQNFQSNTNFVPNKGQITDVNHQVRSDVLYSLNNSSIFLRDKGVSYVFSNANAIYAEVKTRTTQLLEDPTLGLTVNQLSLEAELLREYQIFMHQVDMNFVNSNVQSVAEGKGVSTDFCNYYNGTHSEGITNVKAFNTVTYNEIYKGIHAQFHTTPSGDLKYDFIIEPKANPNKIEMEWLGADSIYINKNKDLIIVTQFDTIKESIPAVYQTINNQRVAIRCQYVLEQTKKGYNVSFALGNYDKNYRLIIDPWITNYGGPGEDAVYEITTDTDGNIYMSGETTSITMIAESGFQMTNGGGFDAFLVKFSPEGGRVWATYYGAGARENGAGVAVDSDGNIYVGGTSNSPTGIAFDGFQETNAGAYDAFLVKFGPAGDRIWATYYGGTSSDYVFNIAIDPFDNIYVCGFTESGAGMSFEGYQDGFGGFADAFIVKFTPDGDREWCTYYGGVNAEIFHAMHFDNAGNLFASGVTTSPDLIASPGAFQTEIGGGQDAFLVKFDPTGNRLWGTYLGTLWVERGDAVTVDTLGNVYMAGKVTAPSGIASPGAFQDDLGGISDAFLAKFSTDGDRLWSTYVGGELIDYAFAVGVDAKSNNVVITGETFSDDFPVSACAHQSDLIGERNAYVTQFLPDGSLFCSSYLGNDYEQESVSVIYECFVYVAGKSTSSFSTPGSFQPDYGGGALDSWLAQVNLSSCGLTVPETAPFEQEQNDVTSCTPCNGSATVSIADFCLHPQSLKTYKWSNGFNEINTTNISSTIDNICEGDYWVEITINCDEVDTLYFTIENTASITADYSFDPVCVGDPIPFTNLSTTVAGAIVINSWSFDNGELSSDENPSHTYDTPGSYEVMLYVENDSECKDSIVQTVNVYPNYETVETIEVCYGDFYTNSEGDEIVVTEDVVYEFTGSSIYGCDSNVMVNIIVLPIYETTTNIFIDAGDVYTFSSGVSFPVNSDTSFTATYNSLAGCDSLETTYIMVNNVEPPVDEPYLLLEIPNVFTPGDAAGNNTFYFPNSSVVEFYCVVVDRWGNEVFVFNGIEDEWNGQRNGSGSDCDNGVYFYHYFGTFYTGVSFRGQGTVTLIRD